MAEYAQNQAALAAAIGTSRATVVEAARSSDFPKPTKKGYPVERCRKWFQKHARGPYRKGSGGNATTIGGITLTEAKIRDTIEHAENERIKKERQLIGQARELGEIVLAEDARRFNLQMVATIAAIHDALPDVLDRAMPEDLPSAEAWAEIRNRVLDIGRKVGSSAAAAMKELE